VGTLRAMRPSRILVALLCLVPALAAVPAVGGGPTCNGLPATLVGTDGHDHLIGTNDDDVIVGLAGRDVIEGSGGHDTICGGPGRDEIDGGRGSDTIFGEGGPDTIMGGGGSDHLEGGPGRDILDGEQRHDTVAGNGGRDVLFGGPGRDTLIGGGGADEMDGGGGKDHLDGGPAGDELIGVTIRDTIGDPAQVTSGADVLVYESLEVRPRRNAWTTFDSVDFGDRLEVRTAPDGLVIVEHTSPQEYLLGLAEVPFSWPMAALKSQVIAARTYLANLVTFPYGAQATYGFDICDSTSCQVYRGIEPMRSADADRWQNAVDATDGLILLTGGGSPAAALYHSTSGTSTRNIEDVWEGRSPVSYLQAVEVTGQSSPFVTWSYELPLAALLDILAQDGITFTGQVTKIRTKTTDHGEGPYLMRVWDDSGVTAISINTVQFLINVHGPSRYPSLLPALRPDGFRYPQAALSPTMEVMTQPDGMVLISGEGWGHQLGLSQYGAKALAEDGNGYPTILGHFYTGLSPTPDPGFLPSVIQVGLGWERSSVTLPITGRFLLRSPSGAVVRGDGATITIVPYEDGVRLLP
jgi:SpoIID/LytB domain protein